MNFTNLTNVMLFLNKTSLTPSDNITINLLIGMVDGIIKNYCGWEVLAKDYSLSYNGNGTTTLDLKAYPINTLTSLTIDDTEVTSQASLNASDGIIYFTTETGLTFTSGTNNVQAEFNAGYSTVPSDLAYAASWLVVINYNRISQESIGVVSEQFNTIKVEYDKADIPIMVKQVLDRYRYISIY